MDAPVIALLPRSYLPLSIYPLLRSQVVLLGDTNTGKTSLVLRFVEGYYRDAGRSSTVGAFFLTKRLTAASITCKLLLWDTAGQEQFQKLAATYYQHAAAAVLTYDVTNPHSLVRLRTWLADLQRHTGIVPVPSNTAGQTSIGGSTNHGVAQAHPPRGGVGLGNSRGGRQMVLIIAACKSDLTPSPGLQQEARRLAAQIGAVYMETSAKQNIGVTDLFLQVSERVLQTYQDTAAAGMEPTIPVKLHGGVVAGDAGRPSLSPIGTSTLGSLLVAGIDLQTPRGVGGRGGGAGSPRLSLQQDEKKEDDLMDQSASLAADKDAGVGGANPRVTCDGIAGNILTCGATDSGRSCTIM